MGQRLNVEIKFNGSTLANAYYHWSGYTRSSLRILSEVIRTFKDKYSVPKAVDLWDYAEQNETFTDVNIERYQKDKQKLMAIALDLLQSTGATLTMEQVFYLKNFKHIQVEEPATVSRNAGLIGFSPDAIDMTRQWEEARVVYDFGRDVMDLEVWWLRSEEEMISDYQAEGDALARLNDIPDITDCIEGHSFTYNGELVKYIPVDKLPDIIAAVEKTCDDRLYCLKCKDIISVQENDKWVRKEITRYLSLIE